MNTGTPSSVPGQTQPRSHTHTHHPRVLSPGHLGPADSFSLTRAGREPAPLPQGRGGERDHQLHGHWALGVLLAGNTAQRGPRGYFAKAGLLDPHCHRPAVPEPYPLAASLLVRQGNGAEKRKRPLSKGQHSPVTISLAQVVSQGAVGILPSGGRLPSCVGDVVTSPPTCLLGMFVSGCPCLVKRHKYGLFLSNYKTRCPDISLELPALGPDSQSCRDDR